MSEADWGWLRPEEVADQGVAEVTRILERGLSAIDDRLGVEVSDDDGTRTVVITAGDQVAAFGLVRALVDTAPSIPNWSFVALRPPGGFNFEIETGGLAFGAKALKFQPIEAEVGPGQVAIRLLVPNPQLTEWSQIAVQIIEVGLGEEAAARVGHIEIGKRGPDSEDVYPLESLPDYVARHAGRR